MNARCFSGRYMLAELVFVASMLLDNCWSGKERYAEHDLLGHEEMGRMRIETNGSKQNEETEDKPRGKVEGIRKLLAKWQNLAL